MEMVINQQKLHPLHHWGCHQQKEMPEEWSAPKDPSSPRCSSTSTYMTGLKPPARNMHMLTMWPCCTVPPPGKKWRPHWKETCKTSSAFAEDGACISVRQKQLPPHSTWTPRKPARSLIVVHVNGNTLLPCANLRYLGVTLDRTLSFKQHVSNICAKVSAWKSIICHLCGTTWGASAATLRTTMKAIVIAPTEYCAPTWEWSSHHQKLDTCLNTAFQTISGGLGVTPVDHLPVLAGIAPSIKALSQSHHNQHEN